MDREGDLALSNVKTLWISSAPEPPTGISWSFDTGTKTLTVAWTGSASADVSTYRVRSSGGALTLVLASTPVQDTGDTTYQRAFTSETGLWIILVRAVDSDGKEEANVRQAVAIPFENGAPAARPAPPRLVEVEAIEDGKIEVRRLYDPHFEQNGPGAGQEARIYWDAGTGTLDYSTPKATVSMGGPASATRYSWQTSPLTHRQT